MSILSNLCTPKLIPILIFCLIGSFYSIAQNNQYAPNSKGSFFIYWGWNRDAYSSSDIRFTGNNYDFTLQNVIAKDRQSPFNFRTYFSPSKLTIPQYNFRIGYFLTDHYTLSIGADHMKYVLQNYLGEELQEVEISGHIHNSGTTFDGNYDKDTISLSPDFLLFEHTDGLNYENVEFRRFDVLFGRKNFSFCANEGIGLGLLVPRTNTTLLNNPRYDEFHLAGYGSSIILSLNMTFFNYFFIQTEWKGGFVHMPDIRTTMFKEDRASQFFWFSQYNIVFGANFKFKSKNKS